MRLLLILKTAWRIFWKRKRPRVVLVDEDTAVLAIGYFGWRFWPGDLETNQAKLGAGFAAVLKGQRDGYDEAGDIVKACEELMIETGVAVRATGRGMTDYTIH